MTLKKTLEIINVSKCDKLNDLIIEQKKYLNI